MKVLLIIVLCAIAGVKLIGALFPGAPTVPVGSVAPEVCARGRIVPPVTREDGMLYVRCADGVVKLVKP